MTLAHSVAGIVQFRFALITVALFSFQLSGSFAQTYGHWTGERAIDAKEWAEHSVEITAKIHRFLNERKYVEAEALAWRFAVVASPAVAPLVRQARLGKWKAVLAKTNPSDHEGLGGIYTQLAALEPDNLAYKQGLETENKFAEKKKAAEVAQQLKAKAVAQNNEKSFSLAREACYVALYKSLNDPDSAKLDSALSWYVEMRKDGAVLVQPSGRAKNAFGAYMQGTWNCVVKVQGETKSVISLKQIQH